MGANTVASFNSDAGSVAHVADAASVGKGAYFCAASMFMT
jgi:hypothetical protein